MADDDFYLIVADQIDETQRRLITAAIKDSCDLWWHQFLDVWIAQGGGTAVEWGKRLGVFSPEGPSGVLVFKLPGENNRSWYGKAQPPKWQWLLEKYARVDGKPVSSKTD